MSIPHGSPRTESPEPAPPVRSARAELIATLWILVTMLVIADWVGLFVRAMTKSP